MKRSRVVLVFSLLGCAVVSAQVVPGGLPEWRRGLMGLPAQPPATTSAEDIAQMEAYILLATPAFATATPGDYEANRELVRRMTAYLASVEMTTRDPRTRRAILRARRSMYTLGFGMPLFPIVPGGPGAQPAAPPPPPPAHPDEPPFATQLPPLVNVPEADRNTAEELRDHYQGTATRAARIWKNAETLRLSLASRGMALNAATAGSVSRLELDLDLAAEGMEQHDWEKSRSNLESAEAETEKISKVAGR